MPNSLFRTVLVFTSVIWLLCTLALHGAVLPHTPLIPTEAELSRLARVRALLQTSTPTHRNPVHIVFYGQSITLGPWWREVADELRRLYPYADLRIENKAISGFQDWALARTVEADLLPLQPDLVIFHAYGVATSNGTDSFLHTLRSATSAEILVQTDHPHTSDALGEETNPAKLVPTNAIPYRNYVRLPDDADRYGACLARVRDAWKAYLSTNHLPVLSLIDGSIHPNADGYHLMAEFVLAYLRPEGSPTIDPWNCSRAWSAEMGFDAFWHGGVFECDFTGNTVNAVMDGPLNTEIEVWVDGQRAQSLSSLLGFTRVSPTHYSGWPTLSRVGSAAPLQEETWTLIPFNITNRGTNFAFRVEGSLTGPDGEGTNTARFISNSKRVVIESGDHWLPLAVRYSGGIAIPDGFKATWQVERHFIDPIPAGFQAPADFGQTIRLVQGLSDGPHRLRLVAKNGSTPNLRVVRTYSPDRQAALQDVQPIPADELRLRWADFPQGPALAWHLALADQVVEASQNPGAGIGWTLVPTNGIYAAGSHWYLPMPLDLSPRFFRLRNSKAQP